MGTLGLNPKKIVSPVRVQIDTVDFTVAIPQSKLQEITPLIYHWSDKIQCAKTELQSLLGKSLYVSKYVSYARPS